MITDNRLKIFLAVAESGSFTAAARSLGLSQPAVSQCVSQLEAEAGGPLLVRGRGEAALTQRGRVFAEYARRILDLYGELRDGLESGEIAPQQATISLPDGRTAVISAADGGIKINL